MKPLALLAVLGLTAAAFGADEAAHRPMTYGLAIAAGFSPDEAKIISDACWSQDLNKATSALIDPKAEVDNYAFWAGHIAKHPEYAQKLLHDDAAADITIFNPRGVMGRVGPATMIHALMDKLPARSGAPGESRLDEAYRAYLQHEARKMKETADPETARKVQLILVGQYMHEMVDFKVHPPNPILGHAKEGVSTDFAYLHKEQIAQGAARALATMQRLRQEIPSDGKRTEGLKLQTPQERERFSRGLVEKVAAGYDSKRPQSPNAWQKFNADEVSAKELQQVSANVGEYVSRSFREQGKQVFVKVPEFDKVGFVAQDKQFRLEYKGKEVAKVDNLVTWVAGQEPFQDLKKPAREALRNHVAVLHAVGEATRAAADAGVAPGRQAVLQKLEVGGVNLETAMDVLETLDIPDARTDNPIAIIPRPVLVSLAKVLEKKPPKLPIGRVHGFVLAGDDICLVGSRTDEPIETDCLAVAVKTVFKEGRFPAISLDPKPDDLSGPQYSRVIAIPPRSSFARMMIEADYDMKRIMLGLLPARVAARNGYRCAWDLTVEWESAHPNDSSQMMSRFWLYPVALGTGDIRISRDGSIFIFQTRVQVLTEQMALVNSGLSGAGREDPICAEAAKRFTAAYEEIAREHPSFRRLHGLVDLVTVCSAWRRLGLRSPLLDKLAQQPVAEVEVPASYPGLTRTTDVGGRLLVVSGGALARSRMLQDSLRARDTAQMEQLRAAAGSMTDLAADLEDSLTAIVPQADRQGEFQRLLGQGKRCLAARQFEEATRLFEEAARAAPQYPDADILRALALAMQGRGAQATESAATAIAKDPTDPDIADMARAIRARFGDITTADEYERRATSDSLAGAGYGQLVKGQTPEAMDSFQTALKAWPENPDALLGRGIAQTALGHYEAAVKDLLQARKYLKRQGDRNRLAVAMAMSAAARLGELDKQYAAAQLHMKSAVEELDTVAEEADQAIALDARLELAHYSHVQGRALKVGLLQAAGEGIRWDNVQAAADEFVRSRPDSSLAWSAHSSVRFFREDYAGAAADLTKAIAINGASAALYRQRAVAYHKAGDFEKAAADYNMSLKLAPADWGYAENTRQFLQRARDKKTVP